MIPERISIGKLLADREPFFIPSYQRGYAWEQNEIDDFIGDMNTLLHAKRNGKDRSHFLGGIVSIKQPAPGTKQGDKQEIVDGQQRLATFTLTISLITHALKLLEKQAKKEKDSKVEQLAKLDEEETRTEYIEFSQTDDSTAKKIPYPRLQLSKIDNDYFLSLVKGGAKKPARSAPASHKKLYKAYTLIRDNLVFPLLDEEISLLDKRDSLKQLRECVSKECFVIFIWSTNTEEAHQLFSILNDRGKSLSNGDLLRAYTLQILEGHPSLQKQVEEHWDSILMPGTKLVDGFLASYYPSYLGERSPKGDLFRDFKRRVFENLSAPLSANDAISVEGNVKNLKEEQKIYEKIVKCEWPYEASTLGKWEHERLKRLVSTLRHDLCIPLLMSAYQHLQEQTFFETLCLLERFVFRYIIIVGAHANPLRDVYYKYSVSIRAGIPFDLKAFEEELRLLAVAKANDGIFKTQLTEGELDYSKKAPQQNKYIRHFLITLDDYANWYDKNHHQPKKGTPKPETMHVIDVDKATIEHIYPQEATNKDPDLDKQLNDIGNLAILPSGPNSRLGNKAFADKRDEYTKSPAILTREVADFTEWTSQSVNDRRTRLIDMAMEIFRIGKVKSEVSEDA
jgi:hypothetical protein